MTASVVRNRAAIDAAFCSAERVTLAASMTPMLDEVLVVAGGGVEALGAGEVADPLDDDAALEAGVLGDLLERSLERLADDAGAGGLVALQAVGGLGTAAWARSRDTPPPGTTPSSMAALVVDTASSMRCFFSFSSTSVAAPTLSTATPPDSLARRSCSFSRS